LLIWVPPVPCDEKKRITHNEKRRKKCSKKDRPNTDTSRVGSKEAITEGKKGKLGSIEAVRRGNDF